MLASDERAAALYRARGTRRGRTLELDQVLLFSIEDGLVTRVLALPSDPGVRGVLGAVSLSPPSSPGSVRRSGTRTSTEPEQLRVYECDGLTGHRAVPEVVVLPGSTRRSGPSSARATASAVPFVARGAGAGSPAARRRPPAASSSRSRA